MLDNYRNGRTQISVFHPLKKALLCRWRFLVFIHGCVLILWVGIAHAAPFVDNNDGTVTDSGTGLMWQKGDSFHEVEKGLSWYEALEYVGGKNAAKFGGYDDWRLPTKKELEQLWDSGRKVKSKDGESIGLPAEFQGGGSYYLWTSNERGLDHAWYFGLGFKENYFNLKDLADLDQGIKLVRSMPTKGSVKTSQR